jgi:hypothetical protein
VHQQRLITWLVTAALLAACGSDQSGGGVSTSEPAITTTEPATTTTEPATTTTEPAATTQPASTTTQPETTTSEPAQLEQPAIWPAADVVFETPEAAAADFLENVFGEGPLLGEFRAGDQRSGEMEVFASVDGEPIGLARSVLLLRQLGPSDGWFVLAAASDNATITMPVSMALVPAGPLTVEGMATGFEATVVVSAFVAGRSDPEFDREVTMAGNFGDVLPYSVSLDVSAASPGQVVVLLVRGGTGLETDPGDFGAIPVLIGT